MKRLFTCLFTLTLCLLLWTCLTAQAETYGDLTYTVKDGQVTITGYAITIASDLVIPDTIDGYPVTGIGSWAFDYCDDITTVTIPEGVINIGYCAFSNCSELTQITLPKSVNYIGSAAFLRCDNLMDIVIPEGVTSIEGGTFSECSKLTYITIPDSVTEIESSAFSGCTQLSYHVYDYGRYLGNEQNPYHVLIGPLDQSVESCTVHPQTKVIIDKAFSGCVSLIDVTIPDSVIIIGDAAFSDCSNLAYNIYDTGKYLGNENTPYLILVDTTADDITSIAIHDQTRIIMDYALSGCSRLAAVTVPETVTSIGIYAFNGCSLLRSICFDGNAPVLGQCIFYGVNASAWYNADSTGWIEAIMENYSGKITWTAKMDASVEALSYQIQEEQVTITDCAGTIYGELIIPETIEGYPVTKIGDRAFSDCRGLFSVTIPNTVTSFGYNVFSSCHSLAGVWADKSHPLFSNDSAGVLFNKDKTTLIMAPCGIVGDYTIPAGVMGIGERAFYGCNSLIKVIIPDSVTNIEMAAFEGCSKLTDVTIPDSVTSIGYGAFYDCRSFTNMTVPNSVTSMGESVFAQCYGLTSVTISGSVASVETEAFARCSSLIDVTICEGVTSIAARAFDGCYKLTNVTIPESLTQIGDEAFSDCRNLVNISIPDGITAVDADAFDGCTSLVFNEYDNAKYLGNEHNPYVVLLGVIDTDATTIVVHPQTKLIAEKAFSGCESLTDVTLPEGLTRMGDSAFSGCSNLTDITLPGTLTYIGDWAFTNCSSLTQIAIPEGVTNIGYRTFSGCSSLTGISVPDSITDIDTSAFEDCTSLNYNVYDNAKYLGNEDNPYVVLLSVIDTDVAVVTVHPQTKRINSNAFEWCGITGITIPEGVVSIGESAFHGCYKLTDITISQNITTIGENAFENCSSLSGIWVAQDNPFYSSDASGAFFNKDKTSLLIVPSKIGDTYNVPQGVIAIESGAFSGCEDLTSVTIPDSVADISGVFSRSTFSIIVSENHPFYSNDEFGVLFNKDKTELLRVPSSIGKSYTIPDTVKEIDRNAFWLCGLQELTIPASMTYVGYEVLTESSLRTVYCLGDYNYVDEALFEDVKEGIWYNRRVTVYYHPGTENWPEGTTHDGYVTWVEAHFYEDDECTACGKQTSGEYAYLKGNLTTVGDKETTLALYVTGKKLPLEVQQVTSDHYLFDQLVPGNYTLVASKEDHRTETYELTLLSGENVQDIQLYLFGDVNGDGRLNVGDVAKIYAHSKRTAYLTDEGQLLRADVNGDDRINVGDAAIAYAKIKSKQF